MSTWLVRALRVGPTRDTRFFNSTGARVIAGLLPGAPVCDWTNARGLRDHPAPTDIAAHTVGRVARAWLEGSSVFAEIVIEADRVERDLQAREREGTLYDLGVSLQLAEVQLGPAMHDYWVIEGAAAVLALDFVAEPAGDRACVLKHILTKEPS